MKIKILSPILAQVIDFSEEELFKVKKELTYTNTSIQHQIKRHYTNRWFKSNNPDGWANHLEMLKKQLTNTLVYENDGTFIRPGSIPHLRSVIELDIVQNDVWYPTPKTIPWAKPLSFDLYPYQEDSWRKLLIEKHGNVELCTSAGKTAILLKICRESGFKTAIIAPSQSIFQELLDKFEYHFGKGAVGAFGDGKKKLGKRFTICIGDSIANIKPDTKEWEFFSKLEMICVDESHTWGAKTLEDICHGVLGQVPYRMFFSGTQTRGDGSEKLLQSIIGKTVCYLSTKEAKETGYICDHDYVIVKLLSSNPNYSSGDALDMKRIHFLNNKNIAKFSAQLANANAIVHGKQTLILVEELSQISSIVPLLKVPYAYAHSEKRGARLEEVGLEKVDKKESVDRFNKNEVKVLIGTSCIATGTNIYANHHTVNWVGGASEIKTKQGAVGRSVRLWSHNPWKENCVKKDKCTIWDFDVYDVDLMNKHLKERLAFYNDSGSEVKYIRMSK